MENSYYRINYQGNYINRNKDNYIPEWAKYLIAIYNSPLKYQIKDEIAYSKNKKL